MSVVTDVVAVSDSRTTMERLAEMLDEFYERRYPASNFESERAILDYDHPSYDSIQTGPKVGGAEILWFTLNHQRAEDFVSLLLKRGIGNVTLWISAEYADAPEVVVL